MLGAKLGQRATGRDIFQTAVALFALAMIAMTFSPNATVTQP
jgi:hypothetical protein